MTRRATGRTFGFGLAIGWAFAAASPAAAVTFDVTDVEPIRHAVAALVAAAWLAFAIWAIIRGGRAQAIARAARAWGLRLRGLLATAPGAYLMVAPSGAVICSEALRGWLSLDQPATSFADLAAHGKAGLAGHDLEQLRNDVSALAATGRIFERLVRTAQGDRILWARGRPLTADVVGDGGVVVWLTDATDAQQALNVTMQENLRLSRELDAATALLEAAPFPVWRRNADLKLRHVNTAFVRAVEARSASEVIADNMELINNALAAAPEKSAQRARDLGMVQQREENVIIDGERRTLQLIDVPLGEAGVGGFAIDISERERAKAELDRYTRAQNATLNRLSTPVAIFGQDKRLIFFNRALAQMFHLPEVWLADQPHHGELLDRMREKRSIPEQADYRRWKIDQLDSYTRSGEPTEDIWHLPDNRTLRVVTQPHPFGGLLLLYEDMTEKLELARLFDELNKVQRSTLDNLHETVAVFGVNGRLKLLNERFSLMWGVERPKPDEESVDLDYVIACMAPTFADESAASVLRTAVLSATTQRQATTDRLALTDGRELSYSTAPLPDGAALLTLLDVTDSTRIEYALRERAEALEEVDKIKTQFVANMSYELRTPLTSILGFVEMLDQNYLGPLTTTQADYVRNILTSAKRLEGLVSDIIDLSVNEFGAIVLERTTISVSEMITAVLSMIGDDVHTNSLTLKTTIEDRLGTIDGDEKRLKQVLLNLLSNAIRYTPSGGNIHVTAQGDEYGIAIEIRDTGIGIPAEEQRWIMDPFRRGSNSGSVKGIGLGLSLARQLIVLHGGGLDLTSTVGMGTTVAIQLPRIAPTERQPDAG